MAFELPALETAPFRAVAKRIQADIDKMKEQAVSFRSVAPGDHEVRFGALGAFQQAVQHMADVEKELMGGGKK